MTGASDKYSFKRIVADWIKQRLGESGIFKYYLIPRARIKQLRNIIRIRRARKVKIVFLVGSLSMWRFQRLYELLKQDARMELGIAVYPFPGSAESQKNDVNNLLRFFSDKGISVLNLFGESSPGRVLKERENPDIIFYPQPYNYLYGNDLDAQFFDDTLVCYIPYALLVIREAWVDRNRLNDVAWRIFYPTEERKRQALPALYNKGSNIRITGDPMFDSFSASGCSADAWKPQDKQKKRIIWAPHFSLQEADLLHRTSFQWLSAAMLSIANRYKERIQFSFKPHPRLYKALCEMPEWGLLRTEDYYRQWAEGENTQLDVGPYVDLFKESDAMIHDCGSFSVEYLFTKNPVLFTAKDLNAVCAQLNQLGLDAIKVHYACDSEQGVVNFIEDVVFGGSDPLKAEREAFYQKHLLPPQGRSVAENIYNEIITGLGLK